MLENYREQLAYDAIKNGEILELMKGDGRYFYAGKNEPGPFNGYEVLDLLYIVDKFDKQLNVCKVFRETLISLVNGNSDDLYLAILYFVDYIYDFVRNDNAFNLGEAFIEDFLNQLKEKINLSKDVLKSEKSIFGVNKWWSIEQNNKLLLKITDLKFALI